MFGLFRCNSLQASSNYLFLCIRLLILGCTGWTACSTALAQDRFKESQHFFKLTTPLQHDAGIKIDVVEFFGFACSHCRDLDEYLSPWARVASDKVKFHRVPVPFFSSWAPYSRIYLVLESMKREDLVPKVFQAVHGSGLKLDQESIFLSWAENQGLNVVEVKNLWGSFGVESKLKRAEAVTKAYGVTGVPTIFVDGKYKVQSTSVTAAGSPAHRDVPAILDFLVSKALSERSRN